MSSDPQSAHAAAESITPIAGPPRPSTLSAKTGERLVRHRRQRGHGGTTSSARITGGRG
jgi:hypothetical protein